MAVVGCVASLDDCCLHSARTDVGTNLYRHSKMAAGSHGKSKFFAIYRSFKQLDKQCMLLGANLGCYARSGMVFSPHSVPTKPQFQFENIGDDVGTSIFVAMMSVQK